MMEQPLRMDFDRASWFMFGLIVGNFLNTVTTTILLIIWVVISNKPLPQYLGGFYPQDILAVTVGLLGRRVGQLAMMIYHPQQEMNRGERHRDQSRIIEVDIDERPDSSSREPMTINQLPSGKTPAAKTASKHERRRAQSMALVQKRGSGRLVLPAGHRRSVQLTG